MDEVTRTCLVDESSNHDVLEADSQGLHVKSLDSTHIFL